MKDCWIVNLLKYLYRKFLPFILLTKWKKQMSYLRNKIEPIEEQTYELEGRVLILAPHSDDEWIGCSQLICDISLDVVVCNIDMLGGDVSELHKIRREGMENVASSFSRDMLTLTEDKINSLINVIESVKPNFICLPFIVDWHSEHREVMGILNQSFGRISSKDFSVIQYQVSVPIPVAYVNYVKTLSRSKWINKWKYFKKHYPTQTYIPYKRFALNERVNGRIVGEYAAEVYSIMPITEWKVCFRNSFQRQEEIRDLVKLLPDMVGIRERAEVLCHQIFNK